METREFDKFLARVDADLEEARKHVELNRRREDLDRRARQLREQVEALQKRRTLALQLGRHDLVEEIDAPLAASGKELADVRAALSAFGPPAAPDEASLKNALGTPRSDLPSSAVDALMRTDGMGLIDEIEAGKVTLLEWTHEERGAQLRVWALRWRALAERMGQSVARNDPVMRKAYAVIMETRERFPGLPFIEALDPRRHGDWERELETARRELPLVRERVKRHRETELQLDRVRSVPAKYRLPEDAEGMKALREAARPLLAVPQAREKLAAILKTWRVGLGEEFAGLWSAEPAAAPSMSAASVSNREIVSRILNRMLAAQESGGKPAPLDAIVQAAEGASPGRAREAAELLLRQGVLLAKSQARERHVLIDPLWTPAVRRFVNGQAFGNQALDHWCETGGAA